MEKGVLAPLYTTFSTHLSSNRWEVMEFSISFDPFHVRIGINVHHTAFFTMVIISFIIETFTLIQG